MTAEPNKRNGTIDGHGPTLWSTDTHEYAIIINIDWSVTAWRQTRSTGVWESFDLSTITGNPMVFPLDATAQADEHYRLAICRDNSGIVHISGNMHGDALRYVVCTDEDDWTNTASWEDGVSRLPDLSLTGVDRNTYAIFRPAPDGTVVWRFNQQDDLSSVNGRDVLVFEMGPAASSWTPFVSDGHLMSAPEDGDDDPDDTPGRAYTASFRFGPDGTFHFFGLWQMVTLDSTTRTNLFYIRRTPAGVWETASGDPVTMPITLAIADAADDCVIPDQLTYINRSWSLGLDADGHPHIYTQQTAAQTRRHHWWNGSAWQYSSNNDYGHLINIRGELWTVRTALFGKIHMFGPNGENITISGDVPGSFNPQPDPVRELAGVYAVLSPYGDTPRVFTYGDGARMDTA